ncbi:hypothetical protein GQ55_4G201400 [Panicum hallii var. hallii]|uniref:Secreted protein n=1 Tax=Panicum hallii var. hallii TaxID=1504633 RepID=A0A2T7DZ58_9POAL|nr:hypothetical protein GQ55_4G201400 [Panicum hallii var. hallii]
MSLSPYSLQRSRASTTALPWVLISLLVAALAQTSAIGSMDLWCSRVSPGRSRCLCARGSKSGTEETVKGKRRKPCGGMKGGCVIFFPFFVGLI